ncbi:MAG: hypothetical protein JO041_14360 [Acidobacteria bacterium]|nr:hypothetical protein [Acidobacteriota bacterium]
MKILSRVLLSLAACFGLGMAGVAAPSDSAPGASAPAIALDVSQAAPRQVEDSTVRAITRDYGRAWQALAAALGQNRADLLPEGFVGVARQKLSERIAEQQRSGLVTRVIDHGHRLQAVFYSPEGSAMELRDTARYEIQLVDGGSVVSTETVTASYAVLMTVTDDRWKVRVLQETE